MNDYMNQYNNNCPCPTPQCDCMPDKYMIPQENQLDKCCSPKKGRCHSEWIDTSMLSYRFGEDVCQGVVRQRFIPGWLINYCVADTRPGDMGYPDPCNPNVFYEVKDGLVFRVEYCNGIEIKRKFIKKALIEDCAIESVSASKITNVCELFKNNSLVVDGVEFDSKYKSLRPDGIVALSPNVQFLDVVLTDSCQLKAAFTDAVARKAVLPSLTCLGDYNAANDTFTVNLSKIVDGTTMRVVKQTGVCDKLTSYTYTAGLAKGTGTQDNPVSVVANVDNTMKGSGETNNPLGVRMVNPSYIDSTGLIFERAWNPQTEGQGSIVADIEAGFGGNSPTTAAAITTLPFSWQAPNILNSNINPSEYEWLIEVKASWGTDINWANVRAVMNGGVIFDSGITRVIGTRSGTAPSGLDYGKIAGIGGGVLPQQDISQYGDSTGISQFSSFTMRAGAGNTISGRISLQVTFPNNVAYSSVRIPNLNVAPDATRWFNSASLTMEVKSIIKKA